ncbi:hypothetical protein DFJ73DRAFT_821587 [Zopfochytrium polystomum]|nr:hypothetical protein DFJ73DRAFT_821587 [Zopfochytrium polystomum]
MPRILHTVEEDELSLDLARGPSRNDPQPPAKVSRKRKLASKGGGSDAHPRKAKKVATPAEISADSSFMTDVVPVRRARRQVKAVVEIAVKEKKKIATKARQKEGQKNQGSNGSAPKVQPISTRSRPKPETERVPLSPLPPAAADTSLAPAAEEQKSRRGRSATSNTTSTHGSKTTEARTDPESHPSSRGRPIERLKEMEKPVKPTRSNRRLVSEESSEEESADETPPQMKEPVKPTRNSDNAEMTKTTTKSPAAPTANMEQLQTAYRKLSEEFANLKNLRFTQAEELLQEKDRALTDLQKRFDELQKTRKVDQSDSMEQLQKSYAELQGRFKQLNDIRFTEAEKIAEEQRKAASQKCDALEKQIKLLKDSLANAEKARSALIAAPPPPPARKMRTFTCQTAVIPMASRGVNTDIPYRPGQSHTNEESIKAVKGESDEALQAAASAREELRGMSEELSRCIREKSDALKMRDDARKELTEALKWKNDARKEIETMRSSDESKDRELEALRGQLHKSKTQLRQAQSALASETSSRDTYLLNLERMLKFYEETTGVTLQGVEKAVRVLDEDDEDDDEDYDEDDEYGDGDERRGEKGGGSQPKKAAAVDELERARRKSVRRMSMIGRRLSRKLSVPANALTGDGAGTTERTEPVLIYKLSHKGARGELLYTMTVPEDPKSGGPCDYERATFKQVAGAGRPAQLPRHLEADISIRRDLLALFFKKTTHWVTMTAD